MKTINSAKQDLITLISTQLINEITEVSTDLNSRSIPEHQINIELVLDIANKWAETEMIFDCLKSTLPELSIQRLARDICLSPKLYNTIVDLVLYGESPRNAWKNAENLLS